MSTTRRRAAWLLGALGLVLALPLASGPASAPDADAAAGPASATIVVDLSSGTATFTPKVVTLGGGGTLNVVNLNTLDHVVTSVAVDDRGEPLFDSRIPAGTTGTVPEVATLANGAYPYFCKLHPSMKGVVVIEGATGGVEPQLPEFEQPLMVPRRLTGANLRVAMRPALVRMLPHGSRTPLWTYAGTYPGPTIVRPAGKHTRVTFVNRLPKGAGAMTVHVHGDHHASKDDGQPDSYLIRRGRQRTYDFPLTYAGRPEPSSFFFYHDHRMDRTARNIWRGLQGMFILSDSAEEKLQLPTGAHDVPLLVSDRSFRADNTLTNPFNRGPKASHHGGQMSFTGPKSPPDDATVGTHVLVNGRYAPYLDVTATRYRLRLLNGAHNSAYNFSLSDGRPFIQIGTGSGLLSRPVVRQEIMLGPAQRADVLVDFSGETGQQVVLSSVARTDGGEGTGTREATLMQFRVGRDAPDRSRLPNRLPSPKLVEVPRTVSKTWRFGLHTDRKHGSFWSVNDMAFDPDRVDHRAKLGSVERWRLRNTSDATHFVHIHAQQWRTVSRDGRKPPAWELGLEDTWKLDPGEYVDVAARFEDYTGPFMIHCHMLDHEDHGMMARFDVVK